MSSIFEAQYQTMTGREPFEPMGMDDEAPQDIAEVRMPWPPEPDDDDPRTLLAQEGVVDD